MSYQIVNLEKKWSEDTAPENNGFEIHRVIIASSKGLLNISECEQGDINFQSNEGEVIVRYDRGIKWTDFLCGKEVKFGDLPNELQNMICQKALQSTKNIGGIIGVVFREPENELDNDRFAVGENPNPADDYDNIF